MNIKKLYFGLVSLISIIAIAISIWIILSNVWKLIFISDKEYVLNNDYELKSCTYELRSQFCLNDKVCIQKLKNNENYIKKLEECKKSKEEKLLLKRHYQLKLALISAFSTFIVFLILFIFHYFRFKKID